MSSLFIIDYLLKGDGVNIDSTNMAHYFATTASTATALLVGHPWDTLSKRLQIHNGALNYNVLMKSMRNPFAGFGWAAGYKSVQWGGKLAAFKPIRNTVDRKLGPSFSSVAGSQAAPYLTALISGATVGIIEAGIVLPLDTMKVLGQTNPNAIQGSHWSFFRNNYFSLYRGIGPRSYKQIAYICGDNLPSSNDL